MQKEKVSRRTAISHNGKIKSAEAKLHRVPKDIRRLARKNVRFSQTLCRRQFGELAVMNIPQGAEIGEEMHPRADELLVVVRGKGEVTVGGKWAKARKHDILFFAGGQRHNFRNTGKRDCKVIVFCAASPDAVPTQIHASGLKAHESALRHAWEQ